MQKTEYLELPIYDTPDVDVFDLQDWNIANQNLDNAFKQIVSNGEQVEITNTEIIQARKGKSTLKEKIDDIDSSLEQIDDNIKNFLKGSFIQNLDINKINSMINENKPVRIAILGDSTEAGVGSRFGAGDGGYAELGDIQQPTLHEQFCLDLMKKSPYFIKPSPSIGGGVSFFPKGKGLDGYSTDGTLIEYDKYILAYGVPTYPNNSITLNLKHLLKNKKNKMYVIYGERYSQNAGSFDVVSNGKTKTFSTYKPPVSFGSVAGVTQQGFSLQWGEIEIPTDTESFSITINNIRKSSETTGNLGNVTIVGFYYGDILSFKNMSIRTTTLQNNSNANASKGVTTDNRINSAFEYGANVYFIGWGTNDANIASYPIEEFKQEYMRRINQIKENNPESIIVLNSDYPDRNNAPYFEKVKELALETGVSFFDVSGILLTYNRSDVIADAYCHLTEYGNNVCGNALISLFNYKNTKIDNSIVATELINSTSVSFQNNVEKKLSFDTIINDVESLYNTQENKIVIKTAGIYSITANIVFELNSTGDRILYILKNTERVCGSSIPAPSDKYAILNCSTIVYCIPGDEIKITGSQTSGVSLGTATLNVRSPYVNIIKLY